MQKSSILSKFENPFANDPDKKRKVAPVKLELLITVVPRAKGNFYMDLIQSYDVNMQVGVAGKGTANGEILRLLGLDGNEKTVIFSVVREDRLDELAYMLEQKFRSIKNGDGIAAAVPFSSMIGTLLFGFLSNNRRAVRETAAGTQQPAAKENAKIPGEGSANE